MTEEREYPKKTIAMMRAVAQILEVVAPFSPRDQLDLLVGAVKLSGAIDVLTDDLPPSVREALERIKAARVKG